MRTILGSGVGALLLAAAIGIAAPALAQAQRPAQTQTLADVTAELTVLNG
jgi:hypothetical protein